MDGNPTKGLEVNGLIKLVKKKEIRKKVSLPMARRSMTKKEYRMLERIFKLQSPPSKTLEIIWKFGMPTFLNYQFHLIAKIYDTTQVTINNIRVFMMISQIV
jgi:hypothetical protein